MSKSAWELLEANLEGIDISRAEVYRAVSKEREINGIHRNTYNKLLTKTDCMNHLKMPNLPTFNRFLDKAIKEGHIQDIYEEKIKKLLAPEQLHTLMEMNKMPSWRDTFSGCVTVLIENQKGGTGKSTFAMTLAAGLASDHFYRPRILQIEIDPQGSQGYVLAGMEEGTDNLLTAVDLMLRDGPFGNEMYKKLSAAGHEHATIVKSAIKSTHIYNLDILPAFPDDERFSMSAYLNSDSSKEGSEDHIEFMKKYIIDVVKDDYDFIIIDSGPQINPLVWTAQEAADAMIVPVKPAHLDSISTQSFLSNLAKQRKALPSKGENILDIQLAITNCDEDKNREIHELLKRRFAGQIFSHHINSSDAIQLASEKYCTFFDLIKSEPIVKNKGDFARTKMQVNSVVSEVLHFLQRVHNLKYSEGDK